MQIKKGPVAIDLFCGAGGISIGLEKSGFSTVLAVDSWDVALQTYGKNFAHPTLLGDVSKFSAADIRAKAGDIDIDFVVGGPPCQGFSIQRIGQDVDPRNDLVLKFGQIVADLRPKIFLMENVPGLLGSRGLHIFKQIVKMLVSAGYYVEHRVLNAADFGVPQIRRRVFVIGSRHDMFPAFSFPKPTHGPDSYKTVRSAIGDLGSPWVGRLSGTNDPLHRRISMSDLNRRRLELIPPGGGFEDLPLELRVDCHRNGAAKIGHRAVYGRLAPGQPAATITARFDSFTRGRFAHPWEHRNITLREGARLQTFPDKHLFAGTQEEIAAQIGNAVPPLLASVLCTAIASHFIKWQVAA